MTKELLHLSRVMRWAGLAAVFFCSEAGGAMVTGTVFHDADGSGKLEMGEIGVAGVAVSNGRDVTVTDADGRFKIEAEAGDFVFAVKPSGWTTPVDERKIPRFYHRMENGRATFDFPLYPREEPDEFSVLVFGDTQPRDLQEVYYLAEDSIAELAAGSGAAFGVTLGDIVFNNYDIFDDVNGALATIGVPWRHVIGNHDVQLRAKNDEGVRRLYHEVYGPSYYSFSYGSAHFIVVDNIQRVKPAKQGDPLYRTGLGAAQLEFIENELARIPADQQVFFLGHIPWVGSTAWAEKAERRRFFDLLAKHPRAASFASHSHMHSHEKIGKEEGFRGERPHHLVVMGASSGSWWTGAKDVTGVPHSLMRCGTPTGYGILSVRKADWDLRYKVARRAADYQMRVDAPDSVERGTSAETEVYANIFNALPGAEVVVRVGVDGEWRRMKRANEVDPVYAAAHAREAAQPDRPSRPMPKLRPSPHLWKTTLPGDLAPGFHVIEVRARDKWAEFSGRRLIRIE